MSIKVSVIIPTYNRGYIITRAIDSVLQQTHSSLELIIVDDCSSDNTEGIIASYDDVRVKYIKLDENHGANYARMVGVKASKFQYIAFQDSDDVWLPNKLELQVNYLLENNFDFVGCKFNQYVNDKFKRVIPQETKSHIEDIYLELLKGNFIGTVTFLGLRTVFKEIKFDTSLPRLQDWDFVLQASQKYKIGFLDIPLVDAYLQEDSISQNPDYLNEAFRQIYLKNQQEIDANPKILSYFQKHIYLSSIFSCCERKLMLKSFKNDKSFTNFIILIIALVKLDRPIKKLIEGLK